MYNQFDEPLSGEDFVSIVILSYRRPEYLRNLIQSIHQYADVPFEIIMHDDSSPEEVKKFIFEKLKPYISTLILNPGEVNMGFAAGANKATALANSNYVILLNDDTLLTAPCFKRIIGVLKEASYIGCLGITGGVQGGLRAKQGGTDIVLGSTPCGSGLFAYRKETWQNVGGYSQLRHNEGDQCLYHKVLKYGYLNASLISDEVFFRNVDQEAGYPHATYGSTQFDASYPRIFGIQEDIFQRVCMERKSRIEAQGHQQYLEPEGLANIQYWHDWFDTLSKDGSMHWDRKTFGQEKFSKEIEAAILAAGG